MLPEGRDGPPVFITDTDHFIKERQQQTQRVIQEEGALDFLGTQT